MIQFPSLFSLKAAAIGVAIAFAAGSIGGWKVRDAFCDAAAAKIEVQNLQKQLSASRKASTGDALKAQEDAKKIQTLEEAIRDVTSKISDGECLTSDDTSRLRDLWKR